MSFQTYLTEQIIPKLQADDMPNEELRFVAEVCGMDVAMSLLQNCVGMINLSVPVNGMKHFKHSYIQKCYSDKPTKQTVFKLANELGITAVEINRILGQHTNEKTQQLGLLDQ